MAKTVFEVAFEGGTVCPVILTIATRLPIDIFTNIPITIGKMLLPLPMLQTRLKLALILIPINPGMHPIPIRHPKPPLPHIRIPPGTHPNPLAMLLPIDPLPLIRLPIGPFKPAKALRLPIHKTALKLRAIREFLVALAMLDVALPVALVGSAAGVEHQAFAVAFGV